MVDSVGSVSRPRVQPSSSEVASTRGATPSGATADPARRDVATEGGRVEQAGHRWQQFSATSTTSTRGATPGAGEPEPPITEDVNQGGGGVSLRNAVGLAADIAGIFDPTPISDAVSGIESLSKGDFWGAGLSVAAMVPYLGDAGAKPIKIAARIGEAFPALAKFASRADDLVQTLGALGKKAMNPAVVESTLKAMNNIAERGAQTYAKNPQWLEKAKSLGLPTDGPIAFVPPKNWNASNPQRTSDKKGFIDAFGNEWRKGPSRTAGQPYEWDVVPPQGSALRNLSRDGSHLNVSLDGVITHK